VLPHGGLGVPDAEQKRVIGELADGDVALRLEERPELGRTIGLDHQDEVARAEWPECQLGRLELLYKN
jgi:hypothetical protein